MALEFRMSLFRADKKSFDHQHKVVSNEEKARVVTETFKKLSEDVSKLLRANVNRMVNNEDLKNANKVLSTYYPKLLAISSLSNQNQAEKEVSEDSYASPRFGA